MLQRTFLVIFPFLLTWILSACATKRCPQETIKTARSYAELAWMPERKHVRHGKDGHGIHVDTPDTSLSQFGSFHGWWQAGSLATGMAYKWGGFDTPESFLKGLQKGKKAGDVASDTKIRMDDAAVSSESVGVDCSGFISRCWGLPRHHSTREFPDLCKAIAWSDLKAGDILLKHGHVILFYTWQDHLMIGYESGSKPSWKVRICALSLSDLKKKGYQPWRYRRMKRNDNPPIEDSFFVILPDQNHI